MLTHSRAAIAAGVLAALLTVTGSTAALAAPAAAARNGHEQFRLTTSSATTTREHVQATGVLVTQGHANLGAPAHGREVIWLVFGRGSVRLVTETTSGSVSVPDPTTCKFTEVHRGNYQVRGGRGRFAHDGGAGTFVTRTFGRLQRKNGSCTSALASFWQATTTSGSLSW
jgi:hypothetical protein